MTFGILISTIFPCFMLADFDCYVMRDKWVDGITQIIVKEKTLPDPALPSQHPHTSTHTLQFYSPSEHKH